jgi:imidazolonepropionase
VRLLVKNIGRLFTATPAGVLVGASVLVEDDRIAWVGRAGERPPEAPDDTVDVGGALVTPGLIDAHTHPVYAGSRLPEISRRSAGASYAEISAAGGGITATVIATRAASADDLADGLATRLDAWLAAGTTTVEAKTGYHLDRHGEIATVTLLATAADLDPLTARVDRRLAGLAATAGESPDVSDDPPAAFRPTGSGGLVGEGGGPRVEVTYLGAHAALDDDYARQAASAAEWCGAASAAGARFVDVFCDAGYFTVDQSRKVLEAGRAAGLLPRIHADELARTGGCLLAAEVGAVSADHLLCATEEDARALASAGVVATLCPVTALAMGQMPPARLLADHGVTLALGSDHNPGMSGVTNMALVVGLAVHTLHLSVDEALLAATAGGARSLATPDRGRIAPGLLADLAAWPTDHEGAFPWHLGLHPQHIWLGGRHL